MTISIKLQPVVVGSARCKYPLLLQARGICRRGTAITDQIHVHSDDKSQMSLLLGIPPSAFETSLIRLEGLVYRIYSLTLYDQGCQDYIP
jgi:hypothetical protein